MLYPGEEVFEAGRNGIIRRIIKRGAFPGVAAGSLLSVGTSLLWHQTHSRVVFHLLAIYYTILHKAMNAM